MIKNAIWPINSSERPPWKSTISKILKKRLKMSYKVLHKWNANEEFPKIKKFSWSLFIFKQNLELPKLNQFTLTNSCFHPIIRTYRWWGNKRKHSGTWESNCALSFSAILAFSEFYFYGILVNEGSNGSYTFRHFLDKLTEVRRDQFK